MIPLSSKRIGALLQRYGQDARISGTANGKARMLINEIKPFTHPDLPEDSIIADGLVLGEDVQVLAGDVIEIGAVRWQIQSAVPIDAARKLFQVQLTQIKSGS
jgi:hypothetical protein